MTEATIDRLAPAPHSDELRKKHRKILAATNRALFHAGDSPLDDISDAELAVVINDVVDFTPEQMRDHFSKKAGGFLEERETAVFVNMSENLRALDDLTVEIRDAGGKTERLPREKLLRLFINAKKIDPVLFEPGFALVLAHIQDEVYPKVLIEQLEEICIYFRDGAYREDAAKPPLTDVIASLQEIHVAMATASDEATRTRLEKRRDEHERRFSEEVRRLSRARCLKAEMHERIHAASRTNLRGGVVSENARFLDEEGQALGACFDRCMRNPNGFSLGFATTNGDLDDAHVHQPAKLVGLLCFAISSGLAHPISKFEDVMTIDFCSLTGAKSVVRLEEREKMAADCIHVERIRAVEAMAMMFDAQSGIPLELTTKVRLSGVLFDGLPKGALGFGRIGDVIAEELSAMATSNGIIHLETQPLRKYANKLLETIGMGPDALGLTTKQASSILSSLEALSDGGAPLNRTYLNGAIRNLKSHCLVANKSLKKFMSDHAATVKAVHDENDRGIERLLDDEAKAKDAWTNCDPGGFADALADKVMGNAARRKSVAYTDEEICYMRVWPEDVVARVARAGGGMTTNLDVERVRGNLRKQWSLKTVDSGLIERDERYAMADRFHCFRFVLRDSSTMPEVRVVKPKPKKKGKSARLMPLTH